MVAIITGSPVPAFSFPHLLFPYHSHYISAFLYINSTNGQRLFAKKYPKRNSSSKIGAGERRERAFFSFSQKERIGSFLSNLLKCASAVRILLPGGPCCSMVASSQHVRSRMGLSVVGLSRWFSPQHCELWMCGGPDVGFWATSSRYVCCCRYATYCRSSTGLSCGVGASVGRHYSRGRDLRENSGQCCSFARRRTRGSCRKNTASSTRCCMLGSR